MGFKGERDLPRLFRLDNRPYDIVVSIKSAVGTQIDAKNKRVDEGDRILIVRSWRHQIYFEIFLRLHPIFKIYKEIEIKVQKDLGGEPGCSSSHLA